MRSSCREDIDAAFDGLVAGLDAVLELDFEAPSTTNRFHHPENPLTNSDKAKHGDSDDEDDSGEP